MNKEKERQLIKINTTVSTNCGGNVDTTRVVSLDAATKQINRIDNEEKEFHMAVFSDLYDIGHLRASVRAMYLCDEDGEYIEVDSDYEI